MFSPSAFEAAQGSCFFSITQKISTWNANSCSSSVSGRISECLHPLVGWFLELMLIIPLPSPLSFLNKIFSTSQVSMDLFSTPSVRTETELVLDPLEILAGSLEFVHSFESYRQIIAYSRNIYWAGYLAISSLKGQVSIYKIISQDVETKANKQHAGILTFLWCI